MSKLNKIPKTKTYSTINNYIYGYGIENIEKRFDELNLDLDTKQTWHAFEALSNRKGFDWWFEDLETPLKNEIFNSVRTAIKKIREKQ